MNHFLASVESRRLAERSRSLADRRLVGRVRATDLRKEPDEVAVGNQVPRARIESVLRLRRLEVETRDIAATLGLTVRQVEHAERKGTKR